MKLSWETTGFLFVINKDFTISHNIDRFSYI
jgi:hypothetical protein